MAAAVTLDAICVLYGIDPRVGGNGVTPEAMGVSIPDNLPQAFARVH